MNLEPIVRAMQGKGDLWEALSSVRDDWERDPQAGLRELRAALPTARETHVHQGDLRLSGKTTTFPGALEVRGHLVLEAQAMLSCIGALRVTGNIIIEDFDYTLIIAGGPIHASNFTTTGECIAVGGLVIGGLYWTYLNDHSTYAVSIDAAVVCTDDRSESVGTMRAPVVLDETAAIRPHLSPKLKPEPDDDGFGEWLVERLKEGTTIIASPAS